MGRERKRYEIADNRAEKHVSGGSRQSLKVPQGLGFFQPKKPGTYRLEFIPFEVTESHDRFVPGLQFSRPGKIYVERTFFQHGGVGVNNEAYTCLARTFGKKCPICEARSKLYQSPHKDDEERANQLKPKERQIFLVIERNDRGELDRDIKLWEVSTWNFGKQLDDWLNGADDDVRDSYRQYYHPEKGFTVKLNATEESMGERGKPYLKFLVHEMRPRKEELDPELFEHGYNLDDMVRELSYDDLKKALLGADEDDDADDDSPPDRRVVSRPSRPEESRSTNGTSKHREEKDDGDDETPARGEKREDRAKGETRKFASKDRVSFRYNREECEGTILRIDYDRDVVDIEDDLGKKFKLGVEDITLVESDSTFDRKPEPAPEKVKKEDPPARASKSKWDEDDDPPAVKAPTKKAVAKDKDKDEDDDPPPRKKK